MIEKIPYKGMILFCFLMGQLVSQYGGSGLAAQDLEFREGLELPKLGGGKIAISSFEDQPITVFVLLSPLCPLCRNYSGPLQEMADSFATRGVTFVGVFPGKNWSKKEMKFFKEKYQVKFDLVIDRKYELTDALSGTTTPEVFLISQGSQLQYQGAIDDWFPALGTQRQVVTQHYLQESLEAISSGKTVSTPMVPPVGCLISRSIN